MNLNWLKNLPALQRNLIGGALVAIVLGLVVYFGYLPRSREVDSLKADLAQINSEVSIYQAKVKKLDELLAENDRLQRLLVEQRRQLPEEHEVADLLAPCLRDEAGNWTADYVRLRVAATHS